MHGGERVIVARAWTPLRSFFLLAAAWVDPGRNALQSAELNTRKNPGGWRTPTRDRTGDGSNSSGSAARSGLQDKPLRSLRINGSVVCISTDLIRLMPVMVMD